MGASVEDGVDHPIARAIVQEVDKRGIKVLPAERKIEYQGTGVEATVKGTRVVLGNERLLEEKKVGISPLVSKKIELEEGGKTVVLVGIESYPAGLIALKDSIKDGAKEMTRGLRDINVKSVILSGDNNRTNWNIAGDLGIDTVIAEVRHRDKPREVENLRREGRRVAVAVGDIQDIHMFEKADVGIAINKEVDPEFESSDIIVTKGDIKDIVKAMVLCRYSLRLMRQNLIISFLYHLLSLSLASLNIIHPILAAILSVICVTFVLSNPLRLRRMLNVEQ